MSIFSNFFKKEAPLLGLQGSGGGLGFLAGGGAAEIEATGGYVSQAVGDDSHLYKYHLWTYGMPAPLQNFTVGSERTLDVLIVGGGGGGGGYAAGGGGAGGVLYGQITATEDLTARTVTIGDGGTGGASWNNNGAHGGNSSIILNGVTCTSGGGKGGAGAQNPANPSTNSSAGGASRSVTSGGPGSFPPVSTPGGTLTGYANPASGGTTPGHPRYSGGAGGGAGGAALQAWSNDKGGSGGAAGCFPKFAAGYLPGNYVPAGYRQQIGGGAYAAGGGGGKEDSQNADGQGGAGGVGGGGMGGYPHGATQGQQAFNYGCGGGGGGYSNGPGDRGGNGAPGVVIVRYPMGLAATNSGAVASSSGSVANAIQPGNGYAYHTFTTPGGSITFSQGGEIEVLIVAAGGGGADSGACCVGHGGGGAGGILHGVYTISSGTYPVTVGQGQNGDTGQNSVFNGHTANGGGHGGWYSGSWNQGADGGSGGGGINTEWGTGEVNGHPSPRHGWVTATTQNPSPTPGFDLIGYGSNGGYSPAPISPNQNGMVNGGGGGAGGPGEHGASGVHHSTPDRRGGGGGPGRQFPQFTGPIIGVPSLNPLSGWYGGGGGSGVRDNFPSSGTAGLGGQGGGGNGGQNDQAGNSGQDYSGGGGGGPSGGGSRGASRGGHGIVVIRYKV